LRECRAFDFVTLGTQRVIDADGVLTVPGVIAKAGNVQEYRAHELGLDGDPNRLVKLYRPREEVAKSATTFGKKPITNNHPPDKWITPQNWDRFAVGDSDASVDMQGDDMVTTLTFRKQKAIDDLASGKVALSNGYKFQFDDSRTTTPEGVAVDGWMTNIRGNHIALVDRGRGGPGCVVADEDEPLKGKNMATRITKIGKHSCELELSAADAAEAQNTEIEKMAVDQKAAMQMATDAEKRAVDAETQIASHLTKIAALDAEIIALKAAPAAAPSDEAIEKAAEIRQSVIGDAAILAPDLKPAGKTVNAIRREAIALASAKHASIKAVGDSLLGPKAEDATSDKVEAAFLAAVSIQRNAATAVDTGLGAEMLRTGDGEVKTIEAKDTKAADGSEGLTGRALYVHKLTHRARATA
jgi:hypothetical protein